MFTYKSKAILTTVLEYKVLLGSRLFDEKVNERMNDRTLDFYFKKPLRIISNDFLGLVGGLGQAWV